MARIDKDRQVCLAFQDRDGADVERVARAGFKGADAAFTENDVLVAAAS
jgi:hypothetical protein